MLGPTLLCPGGSACRRRWLDPWVVKIPGRRERQHAPVFLPGECHGQRSLGGYSPQGCKQLEGTEQLTLSLFLSPLPQTCKPPFYFASIPDRLCHQGALERLEGCRKRMLVPVFCSHEKRLTILLLLLSTSSCFPKQPLNPHCSFPIFQI